MFKVAFLSRGRIEGYTEGWREENGRSALVIPHTETGRFSPSSSTLNLLAELEATASKFDRVVVYVATTGSILDADLAASKFSVKSTTIVMCDCGLGTKRELIDRLKLNGAEIKMYNTECGGQKTMGELVKHFLETGEL